MKNTYGHEKNISRVGKIYEQIFTLQQGEQTIQELYTSFCSLLDELKVYQPFVADITKMREYREEFAIAKFLSALKSKIASQIHDAILAGDTIPLLSTTLSRVLRISIGAPTSYTD